MGEGDYHLNFWAKNKEELPSRANSPEGTAQAFYETAHVLLVPILFHTFSIFVFAALPAQLPSERESESPDSPVLAAGFQRRFARIRRGGRGGGDSQTMTAQDGYYITV